MTFLDTVYLAFRNLRQAKLRTSLTTMGVAIGIASLAGMVSLGVGLQNQLVGQFQQSGLFDSITVTSANLAGRGALGGGPFGGGRGGPGRQGRGGGRAGLTAPGQGIASPALPLDDEAVRTIAALADVKDVYPSITVPLQVSYGDVSEFSAATGIPMSSRNEGVFQTMTHGTFFVDDAADACVLTVDAAKRLTKDDVKDLIGKELSLSYAAAPADAAGAAVAAPPGDLAGALQLRRVVLKCPVIGIVERAAAARPFGGAGNADLMIPLRLAKTIFAENVTNVQSLMREPAARRSYGTVTVKVARAQATQDVEAQITKLGFAAFSLNDALKSAKRVFIILDIVLSLIGSIALAVSSLGIVNTMVMSILERTREIGIMKAIGGSDADIRRIFLVEASAIGVLGGVSGLLLGWLVGRAINVGANFYIESQGGTAATLFSLPWWLIGGALAFSLLVSVVAGSYPAGRAAKLDPIQALRHD